MPNNVFRGDAQNQSQRNTITVGGTNAAAQVYTVTINLKEVSVTTAGTETNDEIATAIYDAINASGFGDFSENDWSVDANVITAESREGAIFTQTSGATGTGTLVTATPQTAKGRHHWDDPDNWSLGAVPVNGDSVFIQNSNVDIKYGLSQTAVTLAELNIPASYTGKIGLANVNTSGQGYAEYRPKYLAIKTSILRIGHGLGGGSGMIKLDLSSVQVAAYVYSTGSSDDSGVEPVQLIGTNASNVLNAQVGTIGSATEPGQLATWSVVRSGSAGDGSGDVNINFGIGCTLGTVNQSGGTITTWSDVTTLNIFGGDFVPKGTAAVGTINGEGGNIFHESSGAITTAELKNDCLIDFSRDPRARTVTNLTLNAGTGLIDTFETVTFTNPFRVRCKLSELRALDLGSDFLLQRS